MGTAQNQRVDVRCLERSEVLAGGREQLRAGRVTALDEFHEDRTGFTEQLDVLSRSGHRPVVGSALHRGFRADHPDPAIVGRPYCGANAGVDDADDRDARRDPDLFDGGYLDRIARHDQELHATIDQVGGDLQRVSLDLCQGFRAVREAGGVAHVQQRLTGQEVDDGSGHGQATHTRVEHADRPRVSHPRRLSPPQGLLDLLLGEVQVR